ncbi:MAG: cytoplasmic protein [Defluviitaleaceae bacterium]|nr:cytoplasmic protein [Defluviitaleaceae bacterium]
MEADYIQAHKFSAYNKETLVKDNLCGCFYCLKVFDPKEITWWVDKNNTAVCPYCLIDSIIGESSGYPITAEFLLKMKKYWF